MVVLLEKPNSNSFKIDRQVYGDDVGVTQHYYGTVRIEWGNGRLAEK